MIKSGTKTAIQSVLRSHSGGRSVSRIHMVGINGISMSGLAELLIDAGFEVSGSDLTDSERIARLRAQGATITIGVHQRGNVGNVGNVGRIDKIDKIDKINNPDLLVYTAAVKPDNPELVCAAELGIPLMERAVLLGLLMSTYGTAIAVSGTHGKTTTTSMLTEILTAASLDPTVHIGAEYSAIDGTTRLGSRKYFIAEACEYVDSFLNFRPNIAVILNIDFDHADYFKDIEQVKHSFSRFASNTADIIVANADDENCRAIYQLLPSPAEREKWHFFSLNAPGTDMSFPDLSPVHAVYYPQNISFDGQDASSGGQQNSSDRQEASFNAQYTSSDKHYFQSSFTLCSTDTANPLATIRLTVPGIHNIANALAAALASHLAGCPIAAIAEGLSQFRGVKKRFEFKGTVNGLTLIDDYAHHPSEIRPTLLATKNQAHGARVWCVFQPHTYSRTKAFFTEFSTAFQDAYKVILADIYAARETDPGDISSAALADAINRISGNAVYIDGGFEKIAAYLREHTAPGDIILTMGAGNAVAVADLLLGGCANR